MNIDLNFRNLKRNENINLIYLKSQNGYYYSKDDGIVYEVISSIENGKGSAIQYRYNYNSSNEKNRYMYRIGLFDGINISWKEWKSKFSKIEKNEFTFDPSKRQEIISKRTELLKARDIFFSKFIDKKSFYPGLFDSNDIKSRRSIYLASLKQMGMLLEAQGAIAISSRDIPSKKLESLYKKFPNQEMAIRTDVNGIFVIPKNTLINLPLVRTKEILTKTDNPKINKLTGEVAIDIETDKYYRMGDQNGILIVETKPYEGNQWIRCYTVITIYEIATKIEPFINSDVTLSTSGWTIMARIKNLEDIYTFGGVIQDEEVNRYL